MPVHAQTRSYRWSCDAKCLVVRCPLLPSFLFCVCTGRPATETVRRFCDRPRPKSRCKNLYAEVSEVSQGWIAKASSSREGRLARFGKMLKNAQQRDRVKRGDRSAVNQRGTTTVAEAARQFEQLRQVEDELMNQYLYRQGTTGGHQSGVERVWLSPCTRCVSNRDGGKLVTKQALCEEGKGTGKRLEKVENEMMDLVRGDSRDDSKLKLDLTGRVGAQGRCCSRKQTKEGPVDSTRALTRSTLQVSFPTTSMCGEFVARCSYSRSFLCVLKQRGFSAELSEISHDWSAEASSPCKWYMVGHPTLCEDGWWETVCTSGFSRSRQGRNTPSERQETGQN